MYNHLQDHPSITKSSNGSQESLDEHGDVEAISTFYSIPVAFSSAKVPHIDGLERYQSMYQASLKDPDAFWKALAREYISWDQPFTKGYDGDFATGKISWFSDGKLNVAYNCVDRHAQVTPNKLAILWEGDEPNESRQITFGELRQLTSQVAGYLLDKGVKLGDIVTIYMPMVPETIVAMLACARIGAVHNVVFGGFSAEALAERMVDAKSTFLITANGGYRGGKAVHLKEIADDALKTCPNVKNVLVYRRTRESNRKFTSASDEINELSDQSVNMDPERDEWWDQVIPKQKEYIEPISVGAEHPLFTLYTSGSTGKPKGLVHTSGGYLLYTMVTMKWVFDWDSKQDIYAGMVDVGWISGHSYVVYGPLGNGATTVMFEGTPFYPDASRFWQIVDDLKITQLYTAPTVIRALRRLGDKYLKGFNLSSLRVIGTVGEPINPDAWKWYFEKVGKSNCPVVDTYWQTETGGHVLTPLPGAIPTKAGSTTLPFFGIEPVILDNDGKELQGNDVSGVLAIKQSWPGIARTIYGDEIKWRKTYFAPYKGYYFTGDRAYRDKDGYYWIRGRVDDVINVSGHRLSTAEIEGALGRHDGCTEAAVLGKPDAITGQSIWAFCIARPEFQFSPGDANKDQINLARINLVKELRQTVRKTIGGLAVPKEIVLVNDLPKTRSGKIMRRVLRKMLEGCRNVSDLGDLSTLNNPGIIVLIMNEIENLEQNDGNGLDGDK